MSLDPLSRIRIHSKDEISDAMLVATALLDPDGSAQVRPRDGGRIENPKWLRAAKMFLTGAILHVLYYEDDKTLSGLATYLSAHRTAQMALLDEMLHAGPSDAGGESAESASLPWIAAVAQRMLARPESERAVILSTITASIGTGAA